MNLYALCDIRAPMLSPVLIRYAKNHSTENVMFFFSFRKLFQHCRGPDINSSKVGTAEYLAIKLNFEAVIAIGCNQYYLSCHFLTNI